MLEDLLKIVKENAGDAIINNPAIPNERNDEAVKATATSIFDTLKDSFAGGKGVGDITQMFQAGGLQNSPLIDQIKNTVGGTLAKKFNLPSSATGDLVSQLIPTVLKQFVDKTNDPNDSSLTLDGILKSVGGGGGLLAKLKKLF